MGQILSLVIPCHQGEPRTLASIHEFRGDPAQGLSLAQSPSFHVPIATMSSGMEAISQGMRGPTESIIVLKDLP